MVKFSEHAEETERKLNNFVPEGMYDVTIAEVRRESQRMRPESMYTIVSFDPLPDGEIPPIYINSALVGTKNDQFTHHMAVEDTKAIYKAACINPDDLGELADDDPLFDGLRQIVGAQLRVRVEKNEDRGGRWQTVPVPPAV